MENEDLKKKFHNSFNNLSHSLYQIDTNLKNKGLFITNYNKKNSNQIKPKTIKNIQNLLDDLCQRKKMNFFTFDLVKNNQSLILWNKDSKNLYEEKDIFTFPEIVKKPIKKNIQNVIKKNILFNKKIKTLKETIKSPCGAQIGRYSPNYSYIIKHIPIIHLNLKKRDECENINKYKKNDLKICYKYKQLYYEQFRNSYSLNNNVKKRINYNMWKKIYSHKDIDNNCSFREKKNKIHFLKSKSIYLKNYKYNSFFNLTSRKE